MNEFKYFILGVLFFGCASNGLDIAVFRGNHLKQRLERQVTVDGKKKFEVIYPTDPVFSDMQAVHITDLQKMQRFYNACIRAGVKPE